MNYVRTLVFPLEQAGEFKSKISNLKVTRNKLKSTVFYYPDTDFTDIRSRALESVNRVV